MKFGVSSLVYRHLSWALGVIDRSKHTHTSLKHPNREESRNTSRNMRDEEEEEREGEFAVVLYFVILCLLFFVFHFVDIKHQRGVALRMHQKQETR